MDDLFSITLFTFGVALLGTALILPPGIMIAWLLARRNWRGKSLVETAIALPLVVPPVATGLVLLKLFGRNGPLGQSLNLDVVFTWKAVVLAAGVMALPLLVRTARVAFEEIPREIEDSARVHGADGWQIFFHITIPLATRGLVGGAIMAFARALGEFGATAMVAGFVPGETVTLALGIYHHVQLGRDDAALAMAAVSATLAFVALWLGEHFLRNRPEPAAAFHD